MNGFHRAVKQHARLRLAITGPSGSGKTYTALTLAHAIAGGEHGTVALIDTERGSAAKYADVFPAFDVMELDAFHPDRYIEAIAEAVAGGYRVLVIDSLSHAWNGPGGLLELNESIAKRSYQGNTFRAWADTTPIQNRLIDAITRAEIHIIATMRTKTEYVVEQNERGRSTPRKVGTAPIQRDGMEYEFDIVLAMDDANTATVQKSRCPALSGQIISKPGRPMAQTLMAWLGGDGAEAPSAAATEPEPAKRAAKVTPIRPAAPAVDAANDADALDLSARNVADRTAQQEIVMRLYRHLGIADPDAMDEWLAKHVRPKGAPRGPLSAQALRDGTSNLSASEYGVAMTAIDEQQQRQSQPSAQSTRDARGAL